MFDNQKAFKKLKSSKFWPDVKDEIIKVHVTGNILHRADYHSCYTLRSSALNNTLSDSQKASFATGSPRELSLESFSQSEFCPNCMHVLFGYSAPWRNIRSVGAALQILEAETTLKGLLKINAGTAPSALIARRAKIGPLLLRINSVATGGFSETYSSSKEKLLFDLSQAEVKLTKASQSDESRLKLENKLKAVMLPKRFAGQNVALDDALSLIGISPTPKGVVGTNATSVFAVIEAYAIRKDKVTVLLAPAFVYAFLLQQLFPRATANTLVVSMPAPTDPVVQEMVAKLWDPEGEGALACMQATIEAANII